MSEKLTFRVKELRSLHADLRLVLVLLCALTVLVVAYVAVRIALVRERMLTADYLGLGFFVLACVVLCAAQLHCLRRIRRETRQKVEQLTFVDELTGLQNYRYLEQRLQEEVSRAARYGNALSVAYVDFDGFKQVNDRFGHESGNLVLRLTGNAMRRSVRGEDFIARLGGDEFLIVLPQTDSSGALIAAERILRRLQAVELAAVTGERIEFLSFSMGVASYPQNGETAEALIRAADEAMYRAKRAGGGRVCL